eukprot:2118111-Amphidinium_carterae.1
MKSGALECGGNWVGRKLLLASNAGPALARPDPAAPGCASADPLAKSLQFVACCHFEDACGRMAEASRNGSMEARRLLWGERRIDELARTVLQMAEDERGIAGMMPIPANNKLTSNYFKP